MTIREQIEILSKLGVDFVVVGGQAGVLRQAVEFSHDLDVVIRATPANAARACEAVRAITGQVAEVAALLGRDFQQYVRAEDGTEIDLHLKLTGIPDFDAALRNSSSIDFLGQPTPCLELTALYASKRTDRPRDAVHRTAIEGRLKQLLLDGAVEPDEIVLACCLDGEVASLPTVAPRLADLRLRSTQPLLQARLVATAADERAVAAIVANPALHPAVRSLAQLDPAVRAKIIPHPARFAALLARLPLILPPEGYRLRPVLAKS